MTIKTKSGKNGMKTVKNDPFASKIERDTVTSTVNAEPNEPKQSPKAQKVEKNDNSLKLMAKLFATIKAECINDKIKSHLITVHALLCKIYRRKEHLKALKSKKEGNLPVENNLTNINVASNVNDVAEKNDNNKNTKKKTKKSNK